MTTLVGVLRVVELGDEVVAAGEEQLTVHRVDDPSWPSGSVTEVDVDQVSHATGEQHHRGQRAGQHAVRQVVRDHHDRDGDEHHRRLAARHAAQRGRRDAVPVERQRRRPRSSPRPAPPSGWPATSGPSTTTSTSRNTPARKVDRRVRAPEAFTLIIVWPIMAQPPIPPKKPGDGVGDPLAPGLAGLGRVRVRDVVDDLGRHQRLHQPDEGERQRVRRDGPQGLQVVGHVGDAEPRQRPGQLALVADRGDGHAQQCVTTVSTTMATSGAGRRASAAAGRR